MKKNKRGVGYWLVPLIVLLVVFVLLMVATGKLNAVIKSVAGKKACSWSIIISTLSKVPPECEMEKITITKEDIEKGKGKAGKYIRNFNEKGYKDKNGESIQFEESDKVYLEYALNKIVANEMKSCWDRVLQGKVPMFNRWWELFRCKEKEGDEEKEVTCGKRNKAWEMLTGKYGFNFKPAFCIICSRIKFDEDVQKMFKNQITSLPEMMKNTPVTKFKTGKDDVFFGDSYYEYVLENEVVKKGIFEPQYKYSVDRPYAVVYERVNVWLFKNLGIKAITIANKAIQWDKLERENFQKDISTLDLVPYDEVGQHCVYLMNY